MVLQVDMVSRDGTSKYTNMANTDIPFANTDISVLVLAKYIG
jgi:hypothetical protein